jgi:hypothetical protein
MTMILLLSTSLGTDSTIDGHLAVSSGGVLVAEQFLAARGTLGWGYAAVGIASASRPSVDRRDGMVMASSAARR